jgi:hypothetical protein
MVKKKEFKVGDRVGHTVYFEEDRYGDGEQVIGIRYNPDQDEPDYGVVTDVLSNGKLMITWDSDWKNANGNKPLPANEFLLEEEVEKKFAKLEQEFNQVEKEIKSKLKEAAALIKAAGKLAEKTGNSLADMYDAVGPLRNAMDASGWHSSSWNC